jgi:hypothetical protein
MLLQILVFQKCCRSCACAEPARVSSREPELDRDYIVLGSMLLDLKRFGLESGSKPTSFLDGTRLHPCDPRSTPEPPEGSFQFGVFDVNLNVNVPAFCSSHIHLPPLPPFIARTSRNQTTDTETKTRQCAQLLS